MEADDNPSSDDQYGLVEWTSANRNESRRAPRACDCRRDGLAFRANSP